MIWLCIGIGVELLVPIICIIAILVTPKEKRTPTPSDVLPSSHPLFSNNVEVPHITEVYVDDHSHQRYYDTHAGMGLIGKAFFGESLLVDNPLLPE